MAEGEQVAASTTQVALDGDEPQELDLCEVCAKELLEPVRTLLEEFGQPVAPGSGSRVGASGEPHYHCYARGCDKTFAHGRNLQRHLKRIHDMELPDSALGGEVVEVEVDPTGAPTYPCPECGKYFKKPQAVGAHRAKVHGYVATKGRTG